MSSWPCNENYHKNSVVLLKKSSKWWAYQRKSEEPPSFITVDKKIILGVRNT